jgi:acetoin utilization deacetylase AcuC-like enzyme
MAEARTAFSYDERFLDHDTGQGHPERSARLVAAMANLGTQSWFDKLVTTSPRFAEREWLQTIHSDAYIDHVEDEIQRGAPFVDTPDVAVSAASFDVARLACGAVLQVADAVMADDSKSNAGDNTEKVSAKISNGFALVRPPGHHAENDTALGFCLFNNIAICARYLQHRYGLDKIAIIDWDVHHGNGTQHSFEEDPSVLFLSTHQYPFYPGTGALSETGVGRGRGSVVNCPMAAGSGDAEYTEAFRDKVLPAMDAFAADAILISAGFDAHKDDPLGAINLSTEFYAWATQRVMEVADKHADGRIISVLEGGYDLNALGECVSTHLAELSGLASTVSK